MHKASDKFQPFFVYLALTVITFAVFWQVHNFEFINYDDNVYVTENPNITTGLTFDNYLWAFTTPHYFMWHPVTSLSHMLDCQLFGLNPGWHHLVNLLFHIANVLLLFTVLRKLTGAFWQSAFVAALFAIHPLNVESVAWIAERKSVLGGFFSLLTIAAYVRYVKQPRSLNYLLVVAVFSLALMSKPTTVTLPLILLLLDYWPLERIRGPAYAKATAGEQKTEDRGQKAGDRAAVWLIIEKIPLLLLSAIVSVITINAQKSGGVLESSEHLPIYIRLVNALVSYISYMGKMVYPVNLAVFYPHPGFNIPLWKPGVSFLLLVVVSAGIYLQCNKAYLTVGWLWFLGTLVPMIGLVQAGGQCMADRYTYVSLIGLFIIIAWGATDLLAGFRYRKIILALSSFIAILLLSVCTFFQTGYWRDSQTLFEHALKVTAGNYIAHNNLGRTLLEQNRFDEALNHFQEALVIRPNYPFAITNFGLAYSKLHPQDDIEACRRAIKIDPGPLEAYSYLGVAYEKTDRYREEIETYKRTIQAESDNAGAYNNLGMAYSKVGHWEDAIDMCKKAIEIQPDFVQSYNNLGKIYGLMGRYEEAIKTLEEAVKIKPDYAETYNNLGITFDKLKRYQEAVEFYTRAVKSKPDYADAYNSLGVDFGRLGQHEKAIEAFKEVIKLDPANMEAYGNLGVTYDKLGRFQEAITAYKQAIKISPDNARLHFFLALVYLKAGDKESVQKEYEILKTLDVEKAKTLLSLIRK